MARTVNVNPAIDSELADRLRDLVRQVDAMADRAQASADAASGSVNSWWEGLVGSDTTASGLRTAAKAAHTLADNVGAKVSRLSTNDEALEELREAVAGRWAENLGDIEALGQRLSLAGGVSIVAGDTARDVADAAASAGRGLLAVLPWLPWVLVGLAVVFVVSKVRRVAS